MNLFDISLAGAYMNAMKAADESDRHARRHRRRAEQKAIRGADVDCAGLGVFRRWLAAAARIAKAKRIDPA